jgi:PST family polysaccharide transporter/teichuronic acid exporter
MNSFKNQVLTGFKWTTIGTIVIVFVALLKLSILARYLDKSDFGLMALVTFVMGFMNLFNDMGLTSAILHKQNISEKEYASLYWINLGFSIVLYVLLLAITHFISEFYNEQQLNILIPLLGLNLIISALGRMFKTIESKHLKFKQVTIFEVVAAVISLIFAIYLAINEYGVFTLIYSALLQYSLQNTMYFIYGLKKYGLLFHFNFKETKPFLKIGVYQIGGQVINYFNRDLDILIIGKFFSQDILGGYSLAKQLVFRPAQIINPILVKVASPGLAKIQDNLIELKTNYLKLISIVSKVNFFVYVTTIVFATRIVALFYGEGFDEIIALVQILSIYMVFRAIGNPIGSLITATGKTNLEFYWNLFTFTVTPIFVLVASQKSIVAVAWSLCVAMILLFYPSWRFLVYRILGISFKEYLLAIIKIYK